MSIEEKNQIVEKIKELKSSINNVKGTTCLVYSRVVGYLQPVSNWNVGKKEEFKHRKCFQVS